MLSVTKEKNVAATTIPGVWREYTGNKVVCDMPDDTMHGVISIGEKVMIDTSIRNYLEDGIFAFFLNGTFMIKRLQFLPDAVLVLPANKHYMNFEIDAKDADRLSIIGRVIASQQIKSH
ncbi:S24 family peptidase [Serratia sp. 1D1416]|uniref:S24 family peptidase n=1 Tax=Serratia sp. 1D1416 TaxID=2447890 RepID=UPI001013C8F5|nr:S24 family peptidase [Serratia sp. 1D1416]